MHSAFINKLKRIPAWKAWAATIAWLSTSIVVACIFYDSKNPLSLNEIGDFVGGFIAAPLAFFWLIYGLWQQGRELELNTEALRNQEEELAKQVAALNRHADATFAQVEQAAASEELKQKQAIPQIMCIGCIECQGSGWQFSFRNYGGGFRALAISFRDNAWIKPGKDGYCDRRGEGIIHLKSNVYPNGEYFTLTYQDELLRTGTFMFQVIETRAFMEVNLDR